MMRKQVFTYFIIITALLLAIVIPAKAAGSGNPWLVLASYDINDGSSETITPGSFVIEYTLQNTSETDLINTILLYDQRNSYIVPVHGSANIEYIGKISANQGHSGKLYLFVPEDAPTGIHRFDITLNYNSEDPAVNYQLTSSFSIYIRISNNPALVLKQVDLSSEVTGGGRRYLYIEYENPGTIDFRNLRLMIEGNIDEQQRTQVLPILKAGRSNSIEYPMQFTDTGTQNIDVYISYSDDAGNTYQTPVVSKQADISDTETTESGNSPGQRQEGYISRLLRILLRNLRTPAFLLALVVTAVAIAAIAIIVARLRKQAIRKKWYYKQSDNKNKKKR